MDVHHHADIRGEIDDSFRDQLAYAPFQFLYTLKLLRGLEQLIGRFQLMMAAANERFVRENFRFTGPYDRLESNPQRLEGLFELPQRVQMLFLRVPLLRILEQTLIVALVESFS